MPYGRSAMCRGSTRPYTLCDLSPSLAGTGRLMVFVKLWHEMMHRERAAEGAAWAWETEVYAKSAGSLSDGEPSTFLKGPVDGPIVSGSARGEDRRVSIGVRRAPTVTTSDAKTARLLAAYVAMTAERWVS
jgi:hypothetical protein